MTTASLQRVRNLGTWVLLAGQALFLISVHVWLLTDFEIQAMSVLGSTVVQQGLLMNIVLFVGVSTAVGLGAVRQAIQGRCETAGLVTECRSRVALVAAVAPTRMPRLKNRRR